MPDIWKGTLMAHYVVTGNYTPTAYKGLIARPDDREAAARALFEAAGGRMISYYVTTGDSDFVIVAESDDPLGVLSAMIVANASGALQNVNTRLAYTTAEFMQAQKNAADVAARYRAPGTAT